MPGKTKDSKDVYGAAGKTNLLIFDPSKLKLVTDPKHPLYDPRVDRPLSDDFIANIGHYGVLEPVVVRKNPETGDVEVVAGRQRVRAAIEVNKGRKKRGEPLLQVSAVVKRSEDLGLMGIMASENEARVGTSPLERARLMQRMLDRGSTTQALETSFACSAATVKNALALLEAPAAVKAAVEKGTITAANGYKLSKLEPGEAKKKLAQIETKAPRTAGKRNGAAAKAAKILNGGKAPVGRSLSDQAGRPTIYLSAIETMRGEVEESLILGADYKRHIVACLNYLLGEPEEWNEIAAPSDDSSEDEYAKEHGSEQGIR
jgi:ParB family chromosome partitioning protein